MEIYRKLNFTVAEHKCLHTCLARNTTKLLKEDSNLLMISVSTHKSEGYGTTHSKIYEKDVFIIYKVVKYRNILMKYIVYFIFSLVKI